VEGSLAKKALVARLEVQGLKVGGYEVEGGVGVRGEVEVTKVLAGAWEEVGTLEGEVTVGLQGRGVKVQKQRFYVKGSGRDG
jgi:hypothetical protein